MKKKWLAFPVALVLITGLMVAGCNTGDGNTGDGTGGGTVTKADLQAVIDAATAAKQNVVTDDNGDNTPSWQYWVSEEILQDLDDAIENATTVSLLPNPTPEQLKTAIAALTAALNTFNSAKRQGTKTSGFTQGDMDKLLAVAAAAKEGIRTSEVDGSDVSALEQWVTPAQMNTLNVAISVAASLTSDTNYLALVAAINRFNTVKQYGSKDPADTDIYYTVVQNYGVLHKRDTESLTLRFTEEIPRDGISPADITISPDTGEAEIDPDQEDEGMTNSPGTTRMLYITVTKQGIIKIKINRAGFSSAEREVTVYKQAGYEEDDTITIADVVLIGAPALPTGSLITFARNNGDPIAILPPRVRTAITSISATSPGFEHVIAEFETPVDMLTVTGDGAKSFRWIDMVWDGFGDQYEFASDSTNGSYTGKRWDLHQVMFQLELTNETGSIIRFQKTSETDTSTRAKKPVRFLVSDISNATASGFTSWGTGHNIKKITLRAYNMQLRSPQNNAWASIGTTRNPIIQDTWIISLTADLQVPPTSKVLYNSTDGWIEEIKNPKAGTGDPKASDPEATDKPIVVSGLENTQVLIYWDPINITTATNIASYSSIVITMSPTLSWFGYGSMSLKEGNNVYDEVDRTKNMHFDGGSTSTGMRIPLLPAGDTFNEQKFIGFFFQTNHTSPTDVTITEIKLE